MSVASTLQPDPPPWTLPEQGISRGWEQIKSRGGSYEYNELTYFFLAACVLHNCEIQFDLQNGCEPTAERPCKCA